MEHFAADNPNFQSETDQNVLGRFKTPDDAYRGLIEAQQAISRPFRLPADMAKLTDEQRTEFSDGMKKLKGVPDSADGYELKMPEGMEMDEKMATAFRNFAHESEMSPTRFQSTVDWWNAMQAENGKTSEADNAKALEEAVDKAGKAHEELWKGDKEKNLELINRALMNTTEGDEAIEALGKDFKDSYIMHSLPMSKAMLALAIKAEGEGTFIPGDGPNTTKVDNRTEWEKEFVNSGPGPESMAVGAPTPQGAG